MNISEWKSNIESKGITLRPIWDMDDPDQGIKLRAFQAFKDGAFLRPVIVQELGGGDGVITYAGIVGNTIEDDARQVAAVD